MNAPGKILFACSACGYRARIPDSYAGKPVHCPSCKAVQVAKIDAAPTAPTGATVSVSKVDAAKQTSSIAASDDKIVLDCASCGYKARIPAKYAGAPVKCPGCGTTTTPVKSTKPATGGTGAISRVDRAVPAEPKPVSSEPVDRSPLGSPFQAAPDASALTPFSSPKIGSPAPQTGRTPKSTQAAKAPGGESSGNRGAVHPPSRKVIAPMKPAAAAAPAPAPAAPAAPAARLTAPDEYQGESLFRKPPTARVEAPRKSPSSPLPEAESAKPTQDSIRTPPVLDVPQTAPKKITESFSSAEAPSARKRPTFVETGSFSHSPEPSSMPRRSGNRGLAAVVVLVLTFVGAGLFLYEWIATSETLSQTSADLASAQGKLDQIGTELKQTQKDLSELKEQFVALEQDRDEARRDRDQAEQKRQEIAREHAILTTRVAFLQRELDKKDKEPMVPKPMAPNGQSQPPVAAGQPMVMPPPVIVHPETPVFSDDDPGEADPTKLY